MSNINLLPKEIKEQYECSKKNRKVLGSFSSIIFLSVALIGILLGSKIYLNARYKNAETELAKKEVSMERYGTLEEDSKKLEAKILSAKEIINKKVYFSRALEQISSSVPSKMYLTEIKFDDDTAKRGEITGSAENKKEIASFMKTLEETNIFSYVDLESTEITEDTVLERETESFKISFIIDIKSLNENP